MRRRLVLLKLSPATTFDAATVATVIRRALREVRGTVQFHVLIDNDNDEDEDLTPVDRPAGIPLVVRIEEGDA